MSRTLEPWIGRSGDDAIPLRVRARIFDKAGGRCVACSRDLKPGRWQCDHIVPLILGGRHSEDNLQPLCDVPCHRAKTKLDVKLKAKVARVHKRHLGLKKPRTIRAWRRFNGEIVHAARER